MRFWRIARMSALAAAVLATARGAVGAQGLRFTRLGIEDGLSQSTAYTVTQDVDGFLWVGTQNGLNRYDGTTFRSSWRDGRERSPVSYAFVRSVYSDHRGHMWVGLENDGLHLYDRLHETFAMVPVRDSSGAPRPSPVRYSAFAEVGDTLWVATTEGEGVIEWSASGPAVHMRGPVADSCGPAVTALWPAADTLWLGTGEGYGCVVRRIVGRGGPDVVVARVGVAVSRITGTAAGALYVGTLGLGTFVLHQDGHLRPVGARSRSPVPTDHVQTILTTTSGDTWIGTVGGLGWLRHDGADTIWFDQGSEAAGGLPHHAVETLYEDRSGALWVGTWSGLSRLTPLYEGVRFIPEGLDSHGEPVGGVIAILPDRSGGLLTGSAGGALARVSLSGAGRRVVETGTPPMADIFSMAWDRGGELWVAGFARGIFRRTATGWRSYRPGRDGVGGVPDAYVESVLVDHAGTVWAGSSRAGLLTYDPAEDRFRSFHLPGVDSAYVWPIREDTRGDLWFGKNAAGKGGLFRLGTDRRSLDFFPTAGDHGERPNAGRILTLLPVGDTVVWFGTQGGGLGRLDPRSGALRFFTTEDGLPHNSVVGILEDQAGRIWVSTNHGVGRFDPATKDFWVLQEAAGIPGGRFYANSAYESPDGTLYFGGEKGISVIYPSRIAPRDDPPPIALVRFAVQGAARTGITSASARSGVELGPRENFFTVGFAGLDFDDGVGTRFRYRLDGLEDAWVDAGTARSARYTDVAPGRYNFLVQARKGAGPWSADGLSVPILLRPPFYRTLWFRASLFAVTVAIGLAVIAYRRNELERIKVMRLEIAEELHNDIGANLSAIALKSDLIRRVAREDIRGSAILGDIQRLTQDTMHQVREMIWVVREEHDTIQGLVTRMEDAAGTLLGGVVDYSLVVDPELPNAPLTMAVRQDVYRIFKEALQNVMKHAGECRVDITVLHREPDLVVRVSDDGCGFDESRVEPGNGLKLMRTRTRRQRIRVSVSSSPESGTRVEITARI